MAQVVFDIVITLEIPIFLIRAELDLARQN